MLCKPLWCLLFRALLTTLPSLPLLDPPRFCPQLPSNCSIKGGDTQAWMGYGRVGNSITIRHEKLPTPEFGRSHPSLFTMGPPPSPPFRSPALAMHRSKGVSDLSPRRFRVEAVDIGLMIQTVPFHSLYFTPSFRKSSPHQFTRNILWDPFFPTDPMGGALIVQ